MAFSFSKVLSITIYLSEYLFLLIHTYHYCIFRRIKIGISHASDIWLSFSVLDCWGPHTTLRFWDLRYFVSAHSPHYKPPIPTIQALNSHHAESSLCNYQTCEFRKMPVEALRYSHLNPIPKKDSYKHRSYNVNVNTIVIIGEYNSYSSLELLSIISSLPRSILIKFKFIFKPHPTSTHDYPLFCLVLLFR